MKKLLAIAAAAVAVVVLKRKKDQGNVDVWREATRSN